MQVDVGESRWCFDNVQYALGYAGTRTSCAFGQRSRLDTTGYSDKGSLGLDRTNDEGQLLHWQRIAPAEAEGK